MKKSHTPLRYPGGKSSLANYVKALIATNALWECQYIEPYCGGAGVAMELLREEFVGSVRINDIDPAINCFWRSVLDHTEELCRRISTVRISVPTWRRQRAVLQRVAEHSVIEVGFAAFFLNRANRSGILTAGPIGGLEQTGAWLIDARFNRETLINTIQQIAAFADRIHVHSDDAVAFLASSKKWPRRSFVYLDPPYVVQGKRLYRNSYTPKDHEEVAAAVARLRHPWIVSYDNDPLIRNLYVGRPSITYGIGYSANKRTAGKEIMIFSPGLRVPSVRSPVRQTEELWKRLSAA